MSASAAGKGSPWILSPAKDFVLFFGTPVLVIPAVALAGRALPRESLYLLVAAFGALGHHLPGLLRAYGDRELFARFRTRFVAAPVLLVLACVPLAFAAPTALVLVVFAWGTWHGFMQAHGFARIYASRAGEGGRLLAWLDALFLGSWFAAALAFAPARLHWVVDHFYQGGGPEVPAALLAGAKAVTAVVAITVTIAHVSATLSGWSRGRRPAAPRLLLLAGTAAFFWHVNVRVDDALLAVVLFEIFHDVQYLAIVWLFNRRRVAMGAGVGALARFLFRPHPALVALYVGLVFLYGSLHLVQDALGAGAVERMLAGLLGASALLHFYYDGFIWKLRDTRTREGLALAERGSERDEGPRAAAARPRIHPPVAHALRWALLFVLPVGALAAAELGGAPPTPERVKRLARTFPADAGARRNLAVALVAEGDLAGAAEAARHAKGLSDRADARTREEVRRTHAEVLARGALARFDAGDDEAAAALLAEALASDPAAADRFTERAADLVERREARRAADACAVVLHAAPTHGRATCNLAVALAADGRLAEAREAALRCGALLPADPQAQEVARRLTAVGVR